MSPGHDGEDHLHRAVATLAGHHRCAEIVVPQALGHVAAVSAADHPELGQAEGQLLLDGHANEVARGEAQGVADHQDRRVQPADHLGDCEDEDHYLDEADARGEPAAALHDEHRAHGAQRHVADS